MTIPDPRFRIGGMVFHVTDESPGVVVGYVVNADGMKYLVSWNGRVEEAHYALELTSNRPDWDTDKDKYPVKE